MDQKDSPRGINSQSMIDHNRSLIVRHLINHSVASRASIAKETGLTAAAISKITSALLEKNVLIELEAFAGNKGRKAIGLSLNPNRVKVVGINFTRRTFSVGVFDLGGNLYDSHTEVILPFQGGVQCLRQIRHVVEGFIKKYSEIAAIGMAVPGPYLKREHRISVMTNATEWQLVDFESEMQNIQGRPVFFEHDANAAALAQWYYNTQCSDKSSLAYYMIDDGVGAGVVYDGVILDGDKGYAGEIGHMSVDINGPVCQCGNHGCLEIYCSAIEFVKSAQRLALDATNPQLVNGREFDELSVFEAAKEGNECAKSLVERTGFYMGCGLVNIIYAYSPSVVILGGRMSAGGSLLMNAIKNTVSTRMKPEILNGVQIMYSKLRNDPVFTGAATVAANQVLMNLSKYLD